MEMDLDTIIEIYSQPAAMTVIEPVAEPAVKQNEPVSETVTESLTAELAETEIFEFPEHTFAEAAAIVGVYENLEEAPATEDHELRAEISSIPDKMAFKIGEVADIVGVKQYVLRYWETEFDALKPKKSRQNQRMYTRRDIENVMLIKKLLYRDKFSIEGARRALKSLKSQVRETKQWDQVADRYESAVQHMQSLLADIREMKKSFV